MPLETPTKAFKNVTVKENILFSIAEAALDAPDDPVRSVVLPAVSGGEQTLRELVHEYQTKGRVYRARPDRTPRRAGRPIVQHRAPTRCWTRRTWSLGTRTAGSRSIQPVSTFHKGVLGDWADLVTRTDDKGRTEVIRSTYEVCTFERCRNGNAARRSGASARPLA
jgi:hypothetical protein